MVEFHFEEFVTRVSRGEFELFFRMPLLVDTRTPVPEGYIPLIIAVLNSHTVFAAYNQDAKTLRLLENVHETWLPDITVNVRFGASGADIKNYLLQHKPYVFDLIFMGVAVVLMSE